jgi:hypothetical protein
MSDPLGLDATRTPECIRMERAAPSPMIRNLYRRITQEYSADSLEAKLVLLAHLVFTAYADLKENQTQ